MEYVLILIYFGICYLIADKIGRRKTIGFTKTLLICILISPFIGLLIAEGRGQKNPKGCMWCGNKYNEAEFCGLCGKNDNGDISPYFKAK